MTNLKSFDIKKLRPFRKPDNRLPKETPDEDETIAQLDHDLRPEEQAYVRHYVGYADVLLNEAAEQQAETSPEESKSNVVEMPGKGEENAGSDEDGGSQAA
jgi:uridine kinase